MPDIAALDRLRSQLLTSGVQERNNALYQVIDQLIAYLRQNINATQAQITAITPSGGGGGSTFQSTFPPGMISGYHGDTDGDIIILPNNQGNICCISPIIPGRDGEDGQDAIIVPGLPGLPGLDGLRGPAGMDGEDGADNAAFQSVEAILQSVVSSVYTPTLTDITLGNGSITGRFIRIGQIFFWNAILVWGTTTTYSGGSPQIGTPFTGLSGLNVAMSLYGSYTDTSAGTSYFANLVAGSASSTLLTTFSTTSAQSGNTPITNTLPFTWANTDIVRVSGVGIAAI